MDIRTKITTKTASAYADYASKVIAKKSSGKISVFSNPQFGEIRTAVSKDGEPMLCAKDVAKALGYIDTADAISRHCKSGKKVFHPHANGIGGVNMLYITERDVYRLIMRSNLPEAENFQDWVCDEVLPSIRKTGQYSIKPLTPAQQLLANAQMLVEMEQRQIEIQTQQALLDQRQTITENRMNEIETRVRDNGFMAVIGFANIHHLKLGNKTLQKLGKQCSAWCRRMGITPEQTRHDKWGSVNTYPMQALRDVFKATFPDKSAMFGTLTYWG